MLERIRHFLPPQSPKQVTAAALAGLLTACGGSEPQGHGNPHDDPPNEESSNNPGPAAEEKNGVEVAQDLLAQWKREHPTREWVEKEKETHTIVPPVDNSDLVGNPQGGTYARITELDVETWKRETMKLVAEGSRVFHDAEALGSTNGVSCDMCHPDGSNTHPETYPKFQVQMGRVALLRDMINWCLEQPVKGEHLDPDDPKMRALEAYIVAQRKGTPLAYGKR